MHYACFKGNLKMLELLLSVHGNLRAVSAHGINCLHLACQKNQVDMARLLIKAHKFSPSQATSGVNKTPIHVAAQHGATQVVKYLTEECDVDVLARDKNDDDALTLALRHKREAAAILLVNLKRFDLTQQHKRSGFNYFGYAVAKGCFDVASVMLKQLKANHEPADLQQILNAEIREKKLPDGRVIRTNLLGLCIETRFASGASFLIQECNVFTTDEAREWAERSNNRAISQIKTNKSSKLSYQGVGSEYGDMQNTRVGQQGLSRDFSLESVKLAVPKLAEQHSQQKPLRPLPRLLIEERKISIHIQGMRDKSKVKPETQKADSRVVDKGDFSLPRLHH